MTAGGVCAGRPETKVHSPAARAARKSLRFISGRWLAHWQSSLIVCWMQPPPRVVRPQKAVGHPQAKVHPCSHLGTYDEAHTDAPDLGRILWICSNWSYGSIRQSLFLLFRRRDPFGLEASRASGYRAESIGSSYHTSTSYPSGSAKNTYGSPGQNSPRCRIFPPALSIAAAALSMSRASAS